MLYILAVKLCSKCTYISIPEFSDMTETEKKSRLGLRHDLSLPGGSLPELTKEEIDKLVDGKFQKNRPKW